ncbi:toxin YdaT family protein [Buttiauxella selenatireducens]|uniref:Toxin YdaT family protein n=1 Tax=Buttiauxella selenatireducens TaxID=3073902 RepID=A0ABY9SFY3_9ENTR|nr:toxin YdaT family protein [Buttiauxella sp. R73]WMY76411.1 toxin YdaT family protein [Buttiauxella sp. R73]
MEIKHSVVRDTVRVWAAKERRGPVSTKITNAYFEMGCKGLPLHKIDASVPDCDLSGAIHINQQNIFRWLDSDSQSAKNKVSQLLPAILSVLPHPLSARIVLANSVEYRALQLAKTAVIDATDAYVAATVVDVVNHWRGN